MPGPPFLRAKWMAAIFVCAALIPARAIVPDGLTITGVPDLPEDLLHTVAHYGSSTVNAFMGWDPKTGAMLINSFTDQTMQLHVLLSPGGETRLSTVFPETISGGSFMPNTGDEIVFAADHNGDEFYQLYRLDPATGRTQILTDGTSRNMDAIYDHTGRQIAFLSTLPEAATPSIYVMDPRRADARHFLMALRTNATELEDWAHDGLHLLVSTITSRSSGYLWLLNTDTGDIKQLTTTPETKRPYFKARFTPHDDGAYVIVYGPNDERSLDYVPFTSSAKMPKVPAQATHVDEIALSPDGTWLAYRTDETDSQTLHIFNTVTGNELPLPPLPHGFYSRLRWNGDGTELGFNYGSSALPFQAFAYNLATGKMEQWTGPALATLPPAPPKPELIKIHSFDDLEISGYLYRPDPQKFPGKRPVLVRIHGGPEEQFIPSYLGLYNYYLDELGVALLCPNVRGSSGFGPAFAAMDDGYKREDAVKDIGAFLAWIPTDAQLDGNRIGVQGASYGGYMTLATLAHYSDLVRCGSDLMGITDFVTFLQHTETYRRANRRREYGDERHPEMNAFLQSISPLNHVGEIHVPVMITAGRNDPRVPVTESDQMAQAIRARHGIIWYIVGENEGHRFRRVADAQYQFAAEAYFFQTYLLPEKPAVPPVAAPPASPPIPSPMHGTD